MRSAIRWLVVLPLATVGASSPASDLGISDSGHYITYRGEDLLLVGDSGTQCVMQNANIDYRGWIDDCADRGIRAVHLWSFVPPRQKADGSVIEDRYGYVYPGLTPWARHEGGPPANDGFPQWDLTRFDEGEAPANYWPRLRDLCGYARDRGIIVGITVFFGWPKWNTPERPDWAYHPLNVINGGHLTDEGDIVTAPQTIHSPGTEVWREDWSDGWPDAKKTQWVWERLSEKLIRETEPFGNVFFCFMDEHSYPEGNCGDHFMEFYRSRGAVWVDWEDRRAGVDWVCSPTLPGEDENSAAVEAFGREPVRPYVLLEGPPYMGDGLRRAMWTFLIGGGHYLFHGDERQETVRTGIMGYDPEVDGGDKAMDKRDWLGHASRLLNRRLLSVDAMAPHNELIGEGSYCLASPGREYVIYSLPGATIDDLRLPPGPHRARFYDPRTGRYGDAFPLQGGQPLSIPKPSEADWVLHIRSED
ncbi:MAG: hypothetical protein GF320_15875 [Armatimonadia bacterium]|nr:hypothetical protein [Armatimonadia bacterium]